jgi:hypothetical protein
MGRKPFNKSKICVSIFLSDNSIITVKAKHYSAAEMLVSL